MNPLLPLPCSIPQEASEEIKERWEDGRPKAANYEFSGELVGERQWTEEGQLWREAGYRGGKLHGTFRIWWDHGPLLEEATYKDGKEDGSTRQYDPDGILIGVYVLVEGTGVDLWFYERGQLSEERHLVDSERHGYERWWNPDNRTVYEENHFWKGQPHGILRRWNDKGRLKRGYPQYFVQGERVEKKLYLRACLTDPTLPAFAEAEQAPQRPLSEAFRDPLAFL